MRNCKSLNLRQTQNLQERLETKEKELEELRDKVDARERDIVEIKSKEEANLQKASEELKAESEAEKRVSVIQLFIILGVQCFGVKNIFIYIYNLFCNSRLQYCSEYHIY